LMGEEIKKRHEGAHVGGAEGRGGKWNGGRELGWEGPLINPKSSETKRVKWETKNYER